MEDTVTDVASLVNKFEEAEQSTYSARQKAERDRDYYDGKQWTDTEEAKLRKRGQPVVTFNRVQRKVNFLKGMEAQARKDPKAFPRTPGDDGSAQAATDALRYVCDDQDWDGKRSEAFEYIMVEGTGAIMVGAQQTRNGIDPAIINIPWDRFFADPYSRRVDFSDATYMGIVTWMDSEEAKRKFPGSDDAIESTLSMERDTQTYDDRPKYQLWADYKRKRVRVIEIYYLKNGTWFQCFFTRAGHLKDPQPSPYQDENGEPENPIKAVSAYIDRDNNRYGEVRMMISPQDEINKRRSKGLHLINSRQVRVSRMAGVESGQDASAIKRELAKPDGVVFAEAGEVEVLQTGDLAAANFQMLQEAKAEIDLLGPNAALAGKNENDASGRALMAQQQGGMVEVAVLMDRLRHLSLQVYRAIWARIRQYWDGPRWIRVTDDERNLQWVGLNTPKTMLQVAQERLQDDPEAEFKLAMIARDPRAQQVMEVQNQVAEIDIDIVIDEGMDTPTVQAEQFDTLSKMMPAMTQLPPDALELLIQSSSLRDKDKLLAIVERMKGQGQADPQQAMQAQMEAEAQLQQQQAQVEAGTEIEKAKIKAATDIEVAKIKAEADSAIKMEQMQADCAMNEKRMMADHEMKMRVDEQTGETARRKSAENDQAEMKANQAAMMQHIEALAGMVQDMKRPRRKIPVRDENGFITEVREEYEEAA